MKCLICDARTSLNFRNFRLDIICNSCHLKINRNFSVRKENGYLISYIFTYNDFLDDVIKKYKQTNNVMIAAIFKIDLQFYFKNYFKKQQVSLIAMPTTEEKFKKRLFNPAYHLFTQANVTIFDDF